MMMKAPFYIQSVGRPFDVVNCDLALILEHLVDVSALEGFAFRHLGYGMTHQLTPAAA